ALDAFVPAGDHAARPDTELVRLPAVVRAGELGAILEPAGVVDGGIEAVLRDRAIADRDVLVLEPVRKRHHRRRRRSTRCDFRTRGGGRGGARAGGTVTAGGGLAA